jgi:response regulator RpfG family c-di-GMP phosphodiesterase
MADANSIEVCLLDDDPSKLETKKGVLGSAGWQTRPFSDPDAFLSYARVHAPAFAILDFGGPRARGLQVRARLREISPTTRAIIALKPHQNPARDVLSHDELINLIKQYVGTIERRVLQKRLHFAKRKAKLGFSS